MRTRDLLWGGALVLALSARFAVETALVNRLPAALAVAAAVVPAAAALALVSWRSPAGRAFDRSDRLLAAAVGVAGVWLAPFMVAAVRRTDAPPGAEVLFLTTAVWGLLLVLVGIAAGRRSASPLPLVGALLGITGSVGILANWERPSSFSPFIRYPSNELTMLVAGVIWAVAVLGLEALVRRHGPLAAARAVAIPAAVASAGAAVVLSPGELASVAQPQVWPFVLLAVVATLAVLLALTQLLEERPPHVVAALYFLPPVALTALTLVERVTVAYGPNPIVVWPAVAGILVSCLAAAVVAVYGRSAGDESAPGTLRKAARLLAPLALATAVVGLVRPDLAVSVIGQLSDGTHFETHFSMSGLETVGGWLAACCTLLVLAWAWARKTESRRAAALLLVTVAVSAVAWLPLHSTPTHAWTTWIPAEVQQDFGTEYASRTVRSTTGPWEPAALALAAVAAVLLLLDRRFGDEKAPRGQEVSKA